MYQDISAVGLKCTVLSAITLATGMNIEAWSTDAEPIVFKDQSLADVKMSLNGDLVVNRKPSPIMVTLTLVANSDDAKALQALYDATRVAKNKAAVQDVVTMILTYPQGDQIVLTNGVLINALPGKSVGTDGKIKDMKFDFAFENKSV